MEVSKDTEPKVEVSDKKSYNFVGKKSPRRTRIVVISILAVVLLLGAVIAVSVYFAMRKTTPTRLVEVNLEEGETLAYKVEQQIEIKGSDVRKATIRATVAIRVLNKTSEEYWFAMKFNLSYLDGNVDLRDVKKEKAYFLVHLHINSRAPNRAQSEISESFEVYGHRHTNEEFLRLVYNILKQLLPAVQHNLYEQVDGEKTNSLDPEESPLLPGPVKMHRKANTSDKNSVSIKNHFNHEDFQSFPTEIDLDLKYFDHAVIDKRKGMITESHSNFTQRLNFGEPIRYKNGGFNVSMIEVTLISHISLVEFEYFMESEKGSFQFFVKLGIPKSNASFSVYEKPNRVSANSSQTFTNVTSPSRSRRDAVYVPWKEAGSSNLNFDHQFTLFEKKLIGINVKGEGTVWLYSSQNDMEMGIRCDLQIGSKKETIFHKSYERSELVGRHVTPIELEWHVGKHVSVPGLLIFSVGVDFSLKFQVSIDINFPKDQNSLNPVQLAVEVNPNAGVTASIDGFVSALIVRGGAYGDGTLVRVGLPVTLSYQEERSLGKQWCTSLSVRLTALDLNAGLYYQRRHWWHWGKRHTLYEFGKWEAYQGSWKELERCG